MLVITTQAPLTQKRVDAFVRGLKGRQRALIQAGRTDEAAKMVTVRALQRKGLVRLIVHSPDRYSFELTDLGRVVHAALAPQP